MKKIFLYALMLFSGFSCISCSDDDEKGMANIDREWMTMFICDNNSCLLYTSLPLWRREILPTEP